MNRRTFLGAVAGVAVVQNYFNGKGQQAAENYFWRNSVKCYKWVKRSASQPRG